MRHKNGIISVSPLLICSILFLSCEKRSESHFDKVVRKTRDYDEMAYVGDWVHYKTIVIDDSDDIVETTENTDISITKRYWKTPSEKTPISLFHEFYCGAIYSYIVFEDDNDTVLIHNWGGTLTEMYFRLAEYPDNSSIFRIDRYYKPNL